jgi:hypothetical protein
VPRFCRCAGAPSCKRLGGVKLFLDENLSFHLMALLQSAFTGSKHVDSAGTPRAALILENFFCGTGFPAGRPKKYDRLESLSH